MSSRTDVIVVGSGLAGLVAALTAAQAGASVRLLCKGAGALAIAGGNIDLLGYVNGKAVTDPWQAMDGLAPEHPYRKLGRENVAAALDMLRQCLEQQGWPMSHAANGNVPCNTLVPTAMGTLRPTFLLPQGMGAAAAVDGRRVAVVSVDGLRDLRPALVMDGLARYSAWKGREWLPVILPSPFGQRQRSVSALDLARHVQSPDGRAWLCTALANLAGKTDLVLLPPICGSKPDASLLQAFSHAADCPVLEMACLPPAVGGLRLRHALLASLHALKVEYVENADVLRAETDGRTFRSVVASGGGREHVFAASALVLATGGILGGGISLAPGTATESVLGLSVDLPQDMEQWSGKDIFDNHAYARAGVVVDGQMRPAVNGQALYDNVFFAGKTIAGYDFASEKSGHGVAVATGWQAGRMAAQACRPQGARA